MAKRTSPKRGKSSLPRPVGTVDSDIVFVAIDTLHEDPANAKKHPEKNLAAIRASLLEFGQVEPLIVMADTNRVIGGNGRLAVMRDLGWTEIKVVFFRGSETQARALAIALNRTGELGEWDAKALKDTLESIAADGFDVGKLAITDDDLTAIVNSALGDALPADSADGNKGKKDKKSSGATSDDAAGDQTEEIPERWEVLVKCSTEKVQVELLERLTEEGFECRALIS